MKQLTSDDPGCYICGNLSAKGLRQSCYVDGDYIITYFTGDNQYKAHGGPIIHGGIAASLLDAMMGYSVGYFKQVNCVTAEITVRYVEPLRLGQRYLVRGKIVKDRKLLIETYGEILDNKQNVHVRAFGKFVPIRQGAEEAP